MEQTENITGLQHIGIPTNDIEKSMTFYHSLGFVTAFRTRNEAAGQEVCFLQLGNLCLEIWQSGTAAGTTGAIDHVALNVIDVDACFAKLRGQGYTMLDDMVQFLPFWEKGVRFFTIQGPNGEKIEFSQKL